MYGQDSKLMLEGTELEQGKFNDLPNRLVSNIFLMLRCGKYYPKPGTHPYNPINFKVDYINFNDDNSGVTLGFNQLPAIGADSMLYADEEDMEEMASRLAEIRYCLGSALEGFNFVIMEYGKPIHRTPIVKLPDGRYRTEFAIAKGDYM